MSATASLCRERADHVACVICTSIGEETVTNFICRTGGGRTILLHKRA